MKNQQINHLTSSEPDFIPLLHVKQLQHIWVIQNPHVFILSASPFWSLSVNLDLFDGDFGPFKRSTTHQTEASLAQLLTDCKFTGLG